MKLLKKPVVAWVIAVIFIALGIFIANNKAGKPVSPPSSTGLNAVCDDANVLSRGEEEALSELNDQLLNRAGSRIAFVTANYGKSDLYQYALDYAEKLGLTDRDFIVVLDIKGDSYWLVQGSALVSQFTDDDCGDYAWDYMESDFAKGDYGAALLSLGNALSDWYRTSYNGSMGGNA